MSISSSTFPPPIFAPLPTCSSRLPLRYYSQHARPENYALHDAMLSAWRQCLVDGSEQVTLGDKAYPVRRTAKRALAQVDFEFDGIPYRALEQNPQTKSRWAQLARKGSKVMQFLSSGRYIAVVVDGKITDYTNAKK